MRHNNRRCRNNALETPFVVQFEPIRSDLRGTGIDLQPSHKLSNT